MSGCARRSERGRAARAALLAAALCGAAAAARAGPPERVVSMNLCTDQLALMIGAPGQLVSVSYLSQRPSMSPLAEAAARLPANHGRAEEIYLMRPDVVLADVWSAPPTIAMLRRLGVEVVQFTPGESIGEVRDNILRMGEILGRPHRAAALVAEFDARLAALAARQPERRPRAVLYGPNGYAYGEHTLAGQILKAAGFDNVASELGLDYGGTMPLETLVMAAPDLVITGRGEPGASRAEEMLDHPALSGLRRADLSTGPDWTCATPHALDAAERLAAWRQEWMSGQ